MKLLAYMTQDKRHTTKREVFVMSWSERNAGTNSGRFWVFAGRAYPRVIRGSNPTRQITSDRTNRDSFYYDPAIRLSDTDLDKFQGTEGAPLCVEHNVKDVVGSVHHSWIGDGEERALKIIGRISLETERGRLIADEVKAGKYKGLSVGYGTEVGDEDNLLYDKHFREISLVAEPFFSDCRLADYGVTASKQATNFAPYKSSRHVLELYIEASGAMDSQQQQQQAPPSGPPVSVEELLRETDKLKAHLEQEKKQRESELQRAKQADERLAYYEAKEAKEAADYALAQEPKANAYIEAITASKGKPPSAAMQQAYKETFCNPRHREAAEDMEAQTKQIVELMASKKAAEERAALAEAQAKTYQSAVTKTTEILNHSRSDYASALQPKDSADDAARRKTVEVGASAGSGSSHSHSLALNHIMVPEPSVAELPFLKAYGYSANPLTGVAASAAGLQDDERPFVRSIPVAATHRLMKDSNGNTQHPGSWRYQKGSDAMFAWMCSQDTLRSEGGDLSDVVTLNPSKEMYLRKNADPVGQ